MTRSFMNSYIRRIFNYLKSNKYMNRSRENQNIHKHDYKERRIVGYLKNQVGRTILIMNDFYAIENEDNQTYQRVVPDKFPKELEQDGLRIIYSGEVKEIYPYERMAGYPFKLTNFEILE